MRLRTVPDSDLIDLDYDAYVHDLVQTRFQEYIDKYGRRPSGIYLTHFDALALGRHAFRLVNKPFNLMELIDLSFCDVPIIFGHHKELFKD